MQRNVQPFPVSVLDQADNPRRLVPHNDGSAVRSCTYPYATVLDGIPWWVQGYRLSGPPHRFDGQSLRWGLCITPASRGEESHLYLPQVIKIYGLDLSSPADRLFRENGSQLCPVVCSPYRPGGASLPRLLPPLCHDLPGSRPKPVAPPKWGQAGRFPGSYKDTLTSEGGLPSAFPPLRAVKTEAARCMGLSARPSTSGLRHGRISRPCSPSSTPLIRRSRCVAIITSRLRH
jgi:hypothetical protein